MARSRLKFFAYDEDYVREILADMARVGRPLTRDEFAALVRQDRFGGYGNEADEAALRYFKEV